MSTRQTTTTAATGTPCVVSEHQRDKELLTDLFAAYYKARSNKRNKNTQVRFERNLAENILNLYDEIVSGRFKVGRSTCFIIRRPVIREVFAAGFRDRIVHHLLFNYISPIFERTFICDCYSCREGKGTLYGVQRLEHHLRSCSQNATKRCYILKLDIESYFMNIDRAILYDIVCTRIKRVLADPKAAEWLSPVFVRYSSLFLGLLKTVIFSDPTRGCYRKGDGWDELPRHKSLFYCRPGCGLPIGNLTSQLFSNIYLSLLDNYVKRDLKLKYYGRYVDDFYIIERSKERLLGAVPMIREFLDTRLKLSLHPRKIYLQESARGVRFLGAYITPYFTAVDAQTKNRAMMLWYEKVCMLANPFAIEAVKSGVPPQSFGGFLHSVEGSSRSVGGYSRSSWGSSQSLGGCSRSSWGLPQPFGAFCQSSGVPS